MPDNDMEEKGGTVPETNGLYMVSTLGRVLGLKRGRILKSCIDSSGYPNVQLSVGGKYFTKRVHRLMALLFIQNPERKNQVNHIDGNKTNNVISNLEWATASENGIHAYENGLSVGVRGERVGSSKLTEPRAIDIKYRHEGMTNKSIGDIYGVTSTAVRHIRTGSTWKHI
jgi:hypothetical protein